MLRLAPLVDAQRCIVHHREPLGGRLGQTPSLEKLRVNPITERVVAHQFDRPVARLRNPRNRVD